MKCAKREYVGDFEVATHAHYVSSQYGDLPVKKGQIVFKNLYGDPVIMNKDHFDRTYIPIEMIEKPKSKKKEPSPFELQYIAEYGNYTGEELYQEEDETYIDGTLELSKNKAF